MVRQPRGKRRRGRRIIQPESTWTVHQSVSNHALADDQEGLAEAEKEASLLEAAAKGKGHPGAAGTVPTTKTINCNGVEIRFPYSPYPSQQDMMDKIVQAIQERKHALLESPTGWLENEKQKLRIKEQRERAEHKARLGEAPKGRDSGKELVDETTSPYFATHDDSTQQPQAESSKDPHRSIGDDVSGSGTISNNNAVRHESDSTTLAGSQDQHPSSATKNNRAGTRSSSTTDTDDDFQQVRTKRRRKVKVEYDEDGANGSKSHGSSKLGIDLSSFAYTGEGAASESNKTHVDGVNTPPEYFPSLPKIYFCSRTHKQIAQLIHELRTKTPYRPSCPYYASRAMAKQVDIIFCPYIYIVHPQIRKSMDLTIDNAIVIIDEAHNIEDTARDAGGTQIKLDTLLAADAQLRNMIKENIKAGACMTLLTLVAPFKKIISEQNSFMETYEGGTARLELKDVLAELASFNFSHESICGMERANETLTKALRDKAEMNKHRQKYGDESLTQSASQDKEAEALHISPGVLRYLDGLIAVLKRIFDPENDFKEEYKVVVQRSLSRGGVQSTLGEEYGFGDHHEQEGEASAGPSRTSQKSRSRSKAGHPLEPKEVRSLSFWCLSPGVIFREVGWSARSVVLTSGTLSPMDSFASELQTKFALTLEASHVIDDSQVWAGAFSCGPGQRVIKGIYQFNRTFEYQDEIGDALERIAEVVPNGVLCFVVSYQMVEDLTRRWRDTGLLDRLSKLKQFFVEPRKGPPKEADRILRDFYAAASNKGKSSVKGALLLAVFRGKCSEGIDFSDESCRAVVTVGIPYPNANDEKVKLKKEYNDMRHKEPKKLFKIMPTTLDIPNHSLSEAERIAQDFGRVLERPMETYGRLLTGKRWYDIQAFRAFNQAIGRCIRHREDWGAMIFLDSRMQAPESRHSLSKWVRPLVRNVTRFNGGIEELQRWMAPLLGSNEGLDIRHVKTEEAVEEEAAEAMIDQEQERDSSPPELLKTEDGEPLLSFFLDTGVGRSSSTALKSESRAAVEPQHPATATLKFEPIKRTSLMQQRLLFQPQPSNHALDANEATKDQTVQQTSAQAQPPIAESMSGSSRHSTVTKTAVLMHDSSTEAMVLDDIQDFSDDEYHDAPEHPEDGDTSMHDANELSTHGSQRNSPSRGPLLRGMDLSPHSKVQYCSTDARARSGSVDMQSPPTTPKTFRRQFSFSNLPSFPRSPSFSGDTLRPTSLAVVSSANDQFSPRVAQNTAHVLCNQCNTRLAVCNVRPKVQTVHKLIARQLVANAKRPTRTFSRSSSSSSLVGSSSTTTTILGTPKLGESSSGGSVISSKSGQSPTVPPASAMVLMFPEDSIVSKNYDTIGIGAASQGMRASQTQASRNDGLVWNPIVCKTCLTNHSLYASQRSLAAESDDPLFGHEEEPGWRGVIITGRTPRLLSFGSGSTSSPSSSAAIQDQSFVGQAWFAPKEVRVVV
ncbi:Fanconi anemia group J protein [Actinomortierella ambigua]|nr:Fanconi anemia group J protein [Actinomortierella ambigua]